MPPEGCVCGGGAVGPGVLSPTGGVAGCATACVGRACVGGCVGCATTTSVGGCTGGNVGVLGGGSGCGIVGKAAAGNVLVGAAIIGVFIGGRMPAIAVSVAWALVMV